MSEIVGLSHISGLIPGDRAAATRNSDLIIQRIQELTLLGRSLFGDNVARGYLYFPPGRYYFGRPTLPAAIVPGTEYGDIVIPPDVTLWFAPGAVLVPMAGASVAPRTGEGIGELANSVRLEIHGDIIAERRLIFDIWLAEQDSSSPAGVVLLGDRIREVYPEWWGASPEGGSNPTKNARAIQAAIDAAYHRRVSPSRVTAGSIDLLHTVPDIVRVGGEIVWNRRSSIPVVMMGRYTIAEGLRVGVDESWFDNVAPLNQPPLSGFTLEGERGIGSTGAGSPSLVASTSFRGSTLLTIRGPTNFLIRNVTFDGSMFVQTCVAVEAIDAAWGTATFDGCSFIQVCARTSNPGVSPALVKLDAESRRRPARPGVALDHTPRDYWNITFKRCLFAPASLVFQTEGLNFEDMVQRHLIPDAANNTVGVEVRLGDNEGLDFRECWFREAASPGIRAFSGRFSMNNCLMHIQRPPRLGPAENPSVPYVPETIDGITFLVHPDWRLSDHPHGSDLIIEEPVLPPVASGVEPLIPASCTLHSHVSHSWQMLAARPIPAGLRHSCKPSSVIVLNAKNVLEATPLPRELEPPTIYWSTNGPGAVGSPLVLMGCQFVGRFPGGSMQHLTPGELATYGRTVFVGDGMTGAIFNIGTHLFSDVTLVGHGLSEAIHFDPGVSGPVLQLRPRAPGP